MKLYRFVYDDAIVGFPTGYFCQSLILVPFVSRTLATDSFRVQIDMTKRCIGVFQEHGMHGPPK